MKRSSRQAALMGAQLCLLLLTLAPQSWFRYQLVLGRDQSDTRTRKDCKRRSRRSVKRPRRKRPHR